LTAAAASDGARSKPPFRIPMPGIPRLALQIARLVRFCGPNMIARMNVDDAPPLTSGSAAINSQIGVYRRLA